MAVPYFIKEHLWISASDETKLKKGFVESKTSSKLIFKTKWCHSCERLKKRVTNKYFQKKGRLWNIPLQEMYVTTTIFKWLVSTWHICLIEIKEEKRLKLSDYLNQI